MISARQIKAARAMLDWSREQLAEKSELSVNTVRNIEMGFMSPRGSTYVQMRRAFERAGLEFLGMEGVRHRHDDLYIHQGPESVDAFFGDLKEAVAQKTEAILAVFPSAGSLINLCTVKNDPLGRLEEMSHLASVKCLLPEALSYTFFSRKIEFRSVDAKQINPVPYFIFGNKLALVSLDQSGHYHFVVFQALRIPHMYRQHFDVLWESVELRPTGQAKMAAGGHS